MGKENLIKRIKEKRMISRKVIIYLWKLLTYFNLFMLLFSLTIFQTVLLVIWFELIIEMIKSGVTDRYYLIGFIVITVFNTNTITIFYQGLKEERDFFKIPKEEKNELH
jgi:hypothetical protein